MLGFAVGEISLDDVELLSALPHELTDDLQRFCGFAVSQIRPQPLELHQQLLKKLLVLVSLIRVDQDLHQPQNLRLSENGQSNHLV